MRIIIICAYLVLLLFPCSVPSLLTSSSTPSLWTRGLARLLVLRPSTVFVNCWSLVVRQLCHTSPSLITFHDANAFYWSTAFKTPYTSAASLAVDLLSEHMVVLTCIETQHVHTDKFYVLFLNWSCQSRCSKNTPLIFIWITFAGLCMYVCMYVCMYKPSMGTVYTCHAKQYPWTCTSSLY